MREAQTVGRNALEFPKLYQLSPNGSKWLFAGLLIVRCLCVFTPFKDELFATSHEVKFKQVQRTCTSYFLLGYTPVRFSFNDEQHFFRGCFLV